MCRQDGSHCKSDTRSPYWAPYLRKGGQGGCPLDWLGFNTCPPLKAAPRRPSQWCFLGCQFKSGGCVYTRNFHIWGPGLQVMRQEDFKPGSDKEQAGSHLFSNEAPTGRSVGEQRRHRFPVTARGWVLQALWAQGSLRVAASQLCVWSVKAAVNHM